jgi:hypothetical protein
MSNHNPKRIVHEGGSEERVHKEFGDEYWKEIFGFGI